MRPDMTREEILADIQLLENLIEETRLGMSMFSLSEIPGWEADLRALRHRLTEIDRGPEPEAA